MKLNTTQYYEEFLRYHEMATWQHKNCNLGSVPYSETPWDDDLIKNVHLYDVIERKYAGFTQLLLDMWYSVDTHPYKDKMPYWRVELCNKIDSDFWGLEEWLYVFFVHRLTGSGINYALNPSGYHNSVLLNFDQCDSVSDMVEVIKSYEGPKFTSVGYQIAPFPKPKGPYKKGGDWFMCEVLPILVKRFADFMAKGKKSFRELMSWLENYNQLKGFRVFRFQYAATLADIADFFPQHVYTDSPFFYGKNAIECLSYFTKNRKKSLKDLDIVMDQIMKDTGALPYNAEDIACDAIRWIENYINPKSDYGHLCLDTIWSSHQIVDHPYGRQKPMLELFLVNSFNGKGHPSDDKILKDNKLSVEEYKNEVRKLYRT